MIRIVCHNDNLPERQYVIDVLFSELLGLSKGDYEVVFDQTAEDYLIKCDGQELIVQDHFFRHYQAPLSYLTLAHIPTEPLYLKFGQKSIPVIYGVDKYEETSSATVIGLDVFASSFFMLTRWEEFLLGREEKGDCDESLLFTVKHGLSQRPFIHEYEQLLRSLLNLPEANRKYNVVLTHDVDGFITPSWKKIYADCIKQTVHGYPKNRILNLTWQEEIKYRMAFPSSYSQFEMYTGLAEKYRIPEWFYFKVCGKGEKEATYLFDDVITSSIVGWLRKKNNDKFALGFHPSQNVLGNVGQWEKEVSRIVGLLQGRPSVGRNHHLLYNHSLLRQWEQVSDSPLEISNCVFHRRHGFRSGVCVPYHLFDLYQRRTMSLIEHPCQVMDTVIRYDEDTKTTEEREQDVRYVIERVKEHCGELLLTWHIYIRNRSIISEYFKWCEKVLNYAVDK